MRKIEAKTLNAIDPNNPIKKDWNFGNMAVYFTSETGCSVYLHNNLICSLQCYGFLSPWDTIEFYDAGWKSNTTKSRINIIARFFGVPGVYQHQFDWWIDKKTPWTGSAHYKLPTNEYGVLGRFIDYRRFLA